MSEKTDNEIRTLANELKQTYGGVMADIEQRRQREIAWMLEQEAATGQWWWTSVPYESPMIDPMETEDG